MKMKINNEGFTPYKNLRGFTLIELLVVLALIAILAVVIIVAIKPAEIFKKSRGIGRFVADCCRMDAPGWFKGLIDEVRLYNRALSDSEIKALYEATK